MSEWKPCPFCGADGRAYHRIDLGNGCGAWSCSSCGARGPRAKRDGSDGLLIAAWSTRSTPPRAEVDVLREKAKLADEYAACMKELRDEDGDIYGWDDTHSGNTIVGMDIGDVKDWLARYEALSPAATPPRAEVDVEAVVRDVLGHATEDTSAFIATRKYVADAIRLALSRATNTDARGKGGE